MSNYNVLYGLRILKKITKDFIDSFLILFARAGVNLQKSIEEV